jgi:hypothetical protein
LSFEIRFDGENYGIVLVVGRTIYSGERIDAGKFLYEPV